MSWSIWSVHNGSVLKPSLIVAETALEAIASISQRNAGAAMVPHDAESGYLEARRVAVLSDISTVEGYKLNVIQLAMPTPNREPSELQIEWEIAGVGAERCGTHDRTTVNVQRCFRPAMHNGECLF